MKAIRHALGQLEKLDDPLTEGGHGSIWIDGAGDLYLRGTALAVNLTIRDAS